ncbi:MAG: methenyltetrahydromethanopterin cyclohydrolase, partial [Isosphaeraceae bacterium]
MSLNRRALWLVEAILAHAQERRVVIHLVEGGGRYIDCGIEARGGLLAGVELARVCMGDMAWVDLVPGEIAGKPVPYVQVITD